MRVKLGTTWTFGNVWDFYMKEVGSLYDYYCLQLLLLLLLLEEEMTATTDWICAGNGVWRAKYLSGHWPGFYDWWRWWLMMTSKILLYCTGMTFLCVEIMLSTETKECLLINKLTRPSFKANKIQCTWVGWISGMVAGIQEHPNEPQGTFE